VRGRFGAAGLGLQVVLARLGGAAGASTGALGSGLRRGRGGKGRSQLGGSANHDVYWASAWSRFLFRTCSRFGGSTLIGEACEDSWVFWRWSSLKVRMSARNVRSLGTRETCVRILCQILECRRASCPPRAAALALTMAGAKASRAAFSALSWVRCGLGGGRGAKEMTAEPMLRNGRFLRWGLCIIARFGPVSNQPSRNLLQLSDHIASELLGAHCCEILKGGRRPSEHRGRGSEVVGERLIKTHLPPAGPAAGRATDRCCCCCWL
jgi:hypothetical protein